LDNNQKYLTEGVRAMFLSTLAFSVANILVKQVSHIPAMEVVFFRCTVASACCFIGLYRAKADWKGSNRTILLLRGTFGTIALYCFFLTLQNIPLASAMTIQYLSPIFTTIIAIFLLSEKVKALQWVFYAMAFSGVLFIERFDTRISLKTPIGWDWFFLFLVGVFSQLGQIYLTSALQKEKAASVAIINYTGLVYALSIGFIVFGESQSVETMMGMSLVVLGVILSVFYGRRRREVENIEATAG
jgi:drug/metabolite transporter (DMT)-like permease